MAGKNPDLLKRLDKLKTENALYVKKNFKAAIQKYTSALKLDDKNAVLYCSRAACLLALHKFIEAAEDAKLATKYDPQYIKAHARLASAYDGMGSPEASITSWKRAIELITKDDMPLGVKQLRDSYVASLEAVERAQENARQGPPPVVIRSSSRMPWEIGEEMLPDLNAANRPFSRAWVISCAYKEFKSGLDGLKGYKETPTNRRDAPMVTAKLGTITNLTNGLIRDRRVFHSDLPADKFFPRYMDQVRFESTYYGGWGSGTPEEVIKQAKARLQMEGWSKVRPALSISIRSRFMRGFLQSGNLGRADLGIQFIGHALDIIKLGRKEWPNVPNSEPGHVFEETFLIGMQNEWLDQYVKACGQHRGGGNSPYSLEDLLKEAESLLELLDSDPNRLAKLNSRRVDTGFALSFTTYPKANAYAAIAFYHAEKALITANRDHISWAEYNSSASLNYMHAAQAVPEDDIYHIYFLECSLRHMFAEGHKLQASYPLLQKITAVYPQVKHIWANSTLFLERDQRLQEMIKAQREVSEMLEHGAISMDDAYQPS